MCKQQRIESLKRLIDSETLAWKIRRNALDMIKSAHASHIAAVYSCADIVAVLYADIMRYDVKNPMDASRDRFILSKGHGGVAVYTALAEVGFFNAERLLEYGKDGSAFSCHVSHKVLGVEVSTGSLGHGIGMACGMALNAKLRDKAYRVYCIVGDGECNEGIVWEAAMLAAQHSLGGFTVIVDRNHMQAMGNTNDIINMEPLRDKWESFGWNAVCVNGHSHRELRNAFVESENELERPTVIVADTIKGKGVSFFENNLLWHYRDPQGECYEKAVKELESSKP